MLYEIVFIHLKWIRLGCQRQQNMVEDLYKRFEQSRYTNEYIDVPHAQFVQ